MPNADQELTEAINVELDRLDVLVVEWTRKQAEVAEAEQRLKDLQREERQYAEVAIPELMQSVGLTEVRTRSGVRVKVEDVVHAKINDENRDRAIAWLEENGHGGMIKSAVEVEFDREQVEDAKRLLEDLRRRGFSRAGIDRGVHHSTLKAWARRMLEDGNDFPLDLFGVHPVPTAKIR